MSYEDFDHRKQKLFMTDLRIIRNSRRNGSSFLGVFGRFLKETLDDDRLVETLAPPYFKHWDPNSNRHSGTTSRMILKDFQNKTSHRNKGFGVISSN
jgi:hypothetical protein